MWHAQFGALRVDGGVRFRTVAPEGTDLRLVLQGGPMSGDYEMVEVGGGIFDLLIPDVGAGQRYGYRLGGSDLLPDPASRFQPDGVHGPSEVVDPGAFAWHDRGWRGVPAHGLVIYELHIGTFAPDGTFASVRDRLEALRDLGVTAIEIMPVADFAGSRNWGYDGASPYAPSRAYGRPDDLRALVDRAHHLGLAVILDVVYNHLGPEGAYLPRFLPRYLTDRHETPWGRAVNLDGPGSDLVRRFITDNAVHWIREYHLDGLRLDATHALIDSSPLPFMQEFARHVRGSVDRPIVLHAEDHRNLDEIINHDSPRAWGFDGEW
ncbi:MAG TPA: alpha-amylase family glycosyl hydrolase, partial [Vicinamibacterales bacterium]|nr:alpha-amylase family glycosyl hydrolase [Vicinamibacterales bacterium]